MRRKNQKSYSGVGLTETSTAWAALSPSKTEEAQYKFSMHQDLWSVTEFAALAAGLAPSTFEIGKSQELDPKEFKKRYKRGRQLLKRFFQDADRGVWGNKECIVSQDNVYLSAWQYIKWIAEKKIPVSQLFIDTLPFPLLGLLLEFGSIHATLRTASRTDRRYHKALYLRGAEELLNRSSHIMTPKEIYEARSIKRIEHSIGQSFRRYKRRTFLLWLSSLHKRARGRPSTS